MTTTIMIYNPVNVNFPININRGQPGNPLDAADEGVFCVKVFI